jgi:hypothetical protein
MVLERNIRNHPSHNLKSKNMELTLRVGAHVRRSCENSKGPLGDPDRDLKILEI